MIVCPVITAANHASEPTRGTKISDVVTITTPIPPPSQVHQGRLLAGDLNSGGNAPVAIESSSSMAVPEPKEISEA